MGLLVGLLLIQFIRIDKTLPASDPSQDFLAVNATDEGTANILRNACYDCHSHQTEYPWYTNVAPLSWWIQNHILEGREHLNFSIWSTYPAKKSHHKLEECIEMTKEGEMPLASFTWTHPEARLSSEQKALLTGYFQKLYGEAEE